MLRTATPAPASPPAAARAPAALSVQGLRKRYGALLAVDEICFEVPRGQIVGLLGPNGAGKTSTINMILGILQPSAGSIHIEGVDLATQRSAALAHTNFAAVYASLPGNLSVRQNLRFFALLYDVADSARRIEQLLEEFELRQLADTRCGLLSSGEQTRLALAKALLNEPRLLLLDEPTASLDPSAADLIRRRIRAMASERHCGILWTSHNMYEVQSTCDRVLFLSHGRVLLEGDPRRLPAEHGAATLEELFIRLTREPLATDGVGTLDARTSAPGLERVS
ncbi:MAG TPA: ABC transporter ATP-binding protein [Steroidobacteraceae bacterium]|nr:ABC transporter ATP-binding protein [Steroidobacteraceae bacterium]